MPDIYRAIKVITATIPSGGYTSNPWSMQGFAMVGMKVPVITSGLLTFAVGFTGNQSAMMPVYDRGGTQLTVATPGGTGGVAIGSDSLAALGAYSEEMFISAAGQQVTARQFVLHLKG